MRTKRDRSEGIPQNVNDPNVDFLQVENSGII